MLGELPPSFRTCVELAWESCSAGTFGVGAVITDASGAIVFEGRNRVFDQRGGDSPLQHTRLAHAEMNALARVPSGYDLSTCTLWTSLEPCLMCASTIVIAGVGAVRYLAPDPLMTGIDGIAALNPFFAERWPAYHGPHEDQWAVVGMVLGLHLPMFFGTGNVLASWSAAEPEAFGLARRLVDDGVLLGLAMRGASAADAVATFWPGVVDAATARQSRRA